MTCWWEVEKRKIVGLRIAVTVTTTYFMDLQVNTKTKDRNNTLFIDTGNL